MLRRMVTVYALYVVRYSFRDEIEVLLSETRIFSVVLLVAAGAVAVGAAHLLRMVVRDMVERAREEDTVEPRWFD
jgi:hypothetical protein